MKLTKAQLKEKRLYPCEVCGKTPTDISHIKSRGSGGSMDDWNLLSLCRQHHAEQHRIGWMGFLTMYPKIEKEIKIKGWKIDETHGRFRLIRSE